MKQDYLENARRFIRDLEAAGYEPPLPKLPSSDEHDSDEEWRAIFMQVPEMPKVEVPAAIGAETDEHEDSQ